MLLDTLNNNDDGDYLNQFQNILEILVIYTLKHVTMVPRFSNTKIPFQPCLHQSFYGRCNSFCVTFSNRQFKGMVQHYRKHI